MRWKVLPKTADKIERAHLQGECDNSIEVVSRGESVNVKYDSILLRVSEDEKCLRIASIMLYYKGNAVLSLDASQFRLMRGDGVSIDNLEGIARVDVV